MAEFCIECLNKLSNKNYKEKDYILTEGFCEECGKVTSIVVCERRSPNSVDPISYIKRKTAEWILKNSK